ncbi:hypothetical protein AXG93_3217s1360 [Marchantia polymorpha subsp. ruderalis]|uniref:Uncharacterized protein n=1 Tax=Marchantia polymorpha subsp. ruderalis TaxID=1480154 RepID=A0A176VWE3_MARPO|nr:hypothetical protein AXG93_3217s1360 [Marchantia polymorpha subsp. ruderalis]
MSTKKENADAAAAAADRIKAAALSAAKGLSRAQAERAAAAAARNVNAYGQKEEGPSRWQERKEAKRQMYLMSTEKAVKLGVRKDPRSTAGPDLSKQCQKCFQMGHWTYECKNERVYMSRPSRTQQLKNPKLRPKLIDSLDDIAPANQRITEEEVPREKPSKKSDSMKRKRRRSSGSDSRGSSAVEEYSSDGSDPSSSTTSESSSDATSSRSSASSSTSTGSDTESESETETESDTDSDTASDSETRSDSASESSHRKKRRHVSYKKHNSSRKESTFPPLAPYQKSPSHHLTPTIYNPTLQEPQGEPGQRGTSWRASDSGPGGTFTFTLHDLPSVRTAM